MPLTGPCRRLRNPTCSRQSISREHIMRRRSVLRAGVASGVAALLPRVAIGQSATARVLRFVPQANLTVLDPIVTTAAVTANHAWMVWGYAVRGGCGAAAEAADGRGLHDFG